MTGSSVLETRNLSIYFRSNEQFGGSIRKQGGFVTKAVDNVSLDIKDREVLGLVGESGSGKSTVGKAILLLNQPTSGEIYFEGDLINHYNKAQRRQYYSKVQIILQDTVFVA